MCVTIGALSAFELFQVGATAFSALSSINQGRQAQQAADYRAAQAEADAQAERELGQVRAERTRRAMRSQQSEARAALAASGVEVGAGTPVTIDQDIYERGESDAMQEILLGTRRGQRLDQDAGLQRMAGDNARSAGYAGAFRSVLAGGSELYQPGWRRRGAPVEHRYPDLPEGP